MAEHREDLRDEIYWWSLELVEKGFRVQGIFLLLATWNFAYFRYHMTEFDLYSFKAVLDSCDFDFFINKSFESIDLSDQAISEKIKSIYKKLSDFDGIRYVGASKVMHLLNAHLFVMWDKKIIDHYRAKTTPDGYLDFMRKMQKMYRDAEFKNLRTDGVTIPRAIDICNIELVG
jgi:hypothetical protein